MLLCSRLLIAQIPSREAHKHILKRCRVSAELAQVQALLSKSSKDTRHSGVEFAYRKLVQPRVHAVRLHAGNRRELRRINCAANWRVTPRLTMTHRKLDNIF